MCLRPRCRTRRQSPTSGQVRVHVGTHVGLCSPATPLGMRAGSSLRRPWAALTRAFPLLLTTPTAEGSAPLEWNSGANGYVYFACNSLGGPLAQLPHVTPAQVKAARRIKKLLTGRLTSQVGQGRGVSRTTKGCSGKQQPPAVLAHKPACAGLTLPSCADHDWTVSGCLSAPWLSGVELPRVPRHRGQLPARPGGAPGHIDRRHPSARSPMALALPARAVQRAQTNRLNIFRPSQIARIAATTMLCPSGLFVVNEDGGLDKAEEWSPLPDREMGAPASWAHRWARFGRGWGAAGGGWLTLAWRQRTDSCLLQGACPRPASLLGSLHGQPCTQPPPPIRYPHLKAQGRCAVHKREEGDEDTFELTEEEAEEGPEMLAAAEGDAEVLGGAAWSPLFSSAAEHTKYQVAGERGGEGVEVAVKGCCCPRAAAQGRRFVVKGGHAQLAGAHFSAVTACPRRTTPAGLRSNQWPGAFCACQGARFTNVYVGWGIKNAAFVPTPPPPVRGPFGMGRPGREESGL